MIPETLVLSVPRACASLHYSSWACPQFDNEILLPGMCSWRPGTVGHLLWFFDMKVM